MAKGEGTGSVFENAADDDSDKDSRKSDASYKSSSSDLKYQSSSAESLGRANSDKDRKSSSSRSRSRSNSRQRSHSRSRSFGRYNRRNAVIYKDQRKHRPYAGKFRRDFGDRGRPFKFGNPRFNTFNRFNRKFRNFNSPSPSSSYEGRKPLRNNSIENKNNSKSSKDDSDTKENPKILKPSEIKDNAKQSTQSFLAMLEEKKKTLPFQLSIVQPVETKKISVKIHGFVNTFNSLNEKNAEGNKVGPKNANSNGKESQYTSHSKGSKQIVSLYSSDELEIDGDQKILKASSYNSHNSTREEGEIRSDLDEKSKKKIMKSDSTSSDDSDSSSDKKKKSKKKKKPQKKKKRRHSTSSSSSSESSSSSSSTSESDSSDSSDSTTSSSSHSSEHKKKSKKKRKETKRDKKKKKKLEKESQKKQKNTKGKSLKIKSNNQKMEIKIKDEVLSDCKSVESWPQELLSITKAEPPLQFCINPKFSREEYREDIVAYLSGKHNSHGALRSEYDKFIGELDISSTHSKRKKSKISKESSKHAYVDSFSESSLENKSKLPFIGKMKGFNKKGRSRSLRGQLEPIKLDMNYDYNYYYQYYYANGYPQMESNDQQSAASLSAYYQMMNSYDYSQQQISQWVNHRGFSLLESSKYDDITATHQNLKSENATDFPIEQSNTDDLKTESNEDNKDEGKIIKHEDSTNQNRIEVITTNTTSSSVSGDFVKFDVNSKISYSNGVDDHSDSNLDSPPPSPPPLRPKMTFLEATEPITLPNGVTLPPGTKQIIVHPYNRPVY